MYDTRELPYTHTELSECVGAVTHLHSRGSYCTICRDVLHSLMYKVRFHFPSVSYLNSSVTRQLRTERVDYSLSLSTATANPDQADIDAYALSGTSH